MEAERKAEEARLRAIEAEKERRFKIKQNRKQNKKQLKELLKEFAMIGYLKEDVRRMAMLNGFKRMNPRKTIDK